MTSDRMGRNLLGLPRAMIPGLLLMRLVFSHDRLLGVVAHPDDAELLCAGTARVNGMTVGFWRIHGVRFEKRGE